MELNANKTKKGNSMKETLISRDQEISCSGHPSRSVDDTGETVITIALYTPDEFGYSNNFATATLTIEEALLLATTLTNQVRNSL